MSERKAEDSQVQVMLRGYPGDGNVRPVVRNWTVADFDAALGWINSYSLTDYRSGWFDLLRRLRDERRAEDIHAETERASDRRHAEAEAASAIRQAEAEAANERRHKELARRLDELKKPHWSVVPNFWITALSAAGALAAAYFAWLALKR
ncbi:MAG: hypothetical protein ABSA05_13365 [Opitutaceae bacterium]|jgi:hypothetical protein